MSKAKESSSLNPWEALFSSCTRPQQSLHCRSTADDIKNGSAKSPSSSSSSSSDGASSTNINTPPSTNNNKGGYTILIQHSLTPKSQRQYALSSTIAMHTSDNTNASSTTYASLSSGMASMTLKSSPPESNAQTTKRTFNNGGSASTYGMSGPFLVRQAFNELCNRCNGGVVYVSTLGTNSVLDLNELEEMSNYNSYTGDYYNNISINQDGYDSDDDNESSLQQLQKHQNAMQMFRRNGAMVDLSSNPYGWEDSDTDAENDDKSDSFIHKCNMNKLHPIAMAIRKAATNVESRRHHTTSEQNQNNTQIMQQPVPIIFESMTPLLNAHGVDKVCTLLKSLGRVLTQDSTNKCTTILSPIVVPILYESLRPSEHRCLEDVSDAMVHINLLDSPAEESVSQNSMNCTAVMLSGVMDLVRRGGGGLGGKFIRHCIPFHIMRLSSNKNKNMRDSCYWVLEHDDEESEHISEDIEDKDTKKKEGTTGNGKAEDSKKQLVSDTKTAATNTSRPRIYLQDDDPEFDDYDEEEDDDLDF